jgi:hypothetical protein
MDKPTGEANRSELLEMALKVNGMLIAKSGTATLMDEYAEEEREGSGLGVTVAGVNTRKMIHLASDDDSDGGDGLGAKKGKPVKSSFVVKGFRTADPLQTKMRKVRASTSKATDAMSAIGSYFNPDNVRERDDARANTSMGFIQLQSALTRNEQIQDALRAETHRADKLDLQVTNLKDKLEEQTRRADKLDTQNNALKDKIEDLKAESRDLKADVRSMKRRHRHRHGPDSDSESSSNAPEGRRCRQQRTPSSPQRRGHEGSHSSEVRVAPQGQE